MRRADTLENADVCVPASAWSEFLVEVEDRGPEFVAIVAGRANFTLCPFEGQAAIEAANDHIAARRRGDKKAGAEAHSVAVHQD